MKRTTAVVFLGVAAVVAGACGGGSDDDTSSAGGTEAPVGDTITVLGKEFSYDPATLTLKAGQGSTIVLKNAGSIEHDLTVDEAGFKLTVASGNSADKELKVDKPGTYEFFCSVAGHKEGGMKGELTVE